MKTTGPYTPFIGQTRGKQRPLLLPAGQWGEGPAGLVVQVYAFQCLSDNFPVGLVGTSQQPVMRQRSRGNHLLRCGALHFQRGVLRDVPYVMSFAELPDRHPEQTYLTLLERVSATTELVTGGLGFRFEEGLASGVYLREFVGNGPERLHLQRMVMVFGSRGSWIIPGRGRACA